MPTTYPGRYKFDGVFLLGREELKELDGLMDDTKEAVDSYITRKLERETAKLAGLRDVDPSDKEKLASLREEVERGDWDLRKKPTRTTAIKCKSGKPFGGETFKQVMNIADLGTEVPVSASTSYANGGREVELEVDTSSGEITLSTRGEDALERDVVGPFIDWIQDKQKIPHWRWFNSNVLSFSLFASVFLLLWLLIPQVRTVTERPAIEAKAAKLIEGGIQDDEVTQALEHLLRLNAGLYESREVLSPQPWYFGLVVIWVLLFAAYSLTPKTIIGIGKNTTLLTNYNLRIGAGIWIARAVGGFILIRVIWLVVSLFTW